MLRPKGLATLRPKGLATLRKSFGFVLIQRSGGGFNASRFPLIKEIRQDFIIHSSFLIPH
jgi:hypothetical protein